MLNVDYKLFCDESCHLERDNSPVMTVGHIKVPITKYDFYKQEIKKIKYHFRSPLELKWSHVSNAKLPLYKSLIDYFFSSDLTFRSVLVKYKDNLDHSQFNQGSHDNFYYKMIYFLLYNPSTTEADKKYAVYLDIKDTRSKSKLLKLEEVFNNKFQGQSPFIHFQSINSKESVFLQLTDLFIGAITYKARNLCSAKGNSYAKNSFIDYLESKAGYSLDEGTEPWEKKFNIFDHQPKRKL